MSKDRWIFGGAVIVAAGLVGWLGGILGARSHKEPVSPPPAETSPATTAPVIAAPAPPAPKPRGAGWIPIAPRPAVATMARSQAALVPEQDPDRRRQDLKALVETGDMPDRIDALAMLRSEFPDEAVELSRTIIAKREPELADHAARVLVMGKQIRPEDVSSMQAMVDDPTLSDEDRTGANAAVMMMLREGEGEALAAWTDKALQSDVAWVRGSTVAAVASLPSDQAVPLIAKALADSDPAVAQGAMNALVGMHGGDASLGKDPAAWVQWLEERNAKRAKDQADALALQAATPVVAPGSPDAPEPPEPASQAETVPAKTPEAAQNQE